MQLEENKIGFLSAGGAVGGGVGESQKAVLLVTIYIEICAISYNSFKIRALFLEFKSIKHDNINDRKIV